MHKLFIERYIKQIKKDDILKFGIQNDIYLSNNQLDILYHYLNEFWEDILYGDRKKVFLDMKKRFDEDTFFKMKNLFDEYFERYRDIL